MDYLVDTPAPMRTIPSFLKEAGYAAAVIFWADLRHHCGELHALRAPVH